MGCQTQLLDGDKLRETICKGLGFSRQDRDENIARIGFVAVLLARHKIFPIVAAISPYREARSLIRQTANIEKIQFIEIYVKCPIEVLEMRDTKGLYRKARTGEITRFTGISDPYEEPENPELIVNTDKIGVEEAVTQITDYIFKDIR